MKVHAWRLSRLLGSGGSADVREARTRDGNAVALKILVANDLPKIIRLVSEMEEKTASESNYFSAALKSAASLATG